MRSDFRLIFIIALLLSFAFGLSFNSMAQDSEDTFNEGVELYSTGNYTAAISSWEKLLFAGYSSYDLYYNLGNANFKNGSIPGAILYYEKALLIRPFNEDIKYNLEIARSYLTDNFETIPELFLVRWFKMVSLMMHSNSWAIISLLLFVISLLLILVYLFSVKIGIKKFSLLAGVILLLLSLTSLSLSYQNSITKTRKQFGVIFSPAVTGKSSPDESGKDLFLIHEGTKVRIEDELGGWYEVRLSDGNIGWIPSETITKV